MCEPEQDKRRSEMGKGTSGLGVIKKASSAGAEKGEEGTALKT